MKKMLLFVLASCTVLFFSSTLSFASAGDATSQSVNTTKKVCKKGKGCKRHKKGAKKGTNKKVQIQENTTK